MKKKIAIIYDASIPNEQFKNANDRRVYNINKALLNSNYETIIIHPRWRINNSQKENHLDNDLYIVLGNKYKLNFINRLSFYYKTWLHLKKNSFEIVIFYNTIWDSIILMFLLKISNIRFGMEICDIHSKSKIKINIFKYYFVILPTEFLLNKISDFNIVISKSIQNIISHKSPSLLLPVLVDNDYFKTQVCNDVNFRKKNRIEVDQIIITFCGSYWYYEGSDLLLEALDILINSKKCSNVKVVFVGNIYGSKYKPDLKSITKKLNLSNYVYFTDKVVESDLLSIFSETDIFVLPQIKEGFTDFAFPTIIGEYASMGKAIVASETGELNSIFIDNSDILFFENLNVLQLAEKLEVLILDKNKREILGVNARITSEKYFGLTSNSKKLNHFFNTILYPN